MSGFQRQSILVSYRIDDSEDLNNVFRNNEGVLVLNERLSAAFRILMEAGSIFDSDTTIPGEGGVEYAQLILGPMVRSPECGRTARDHFIAVSSRNWDTLRTICADEVTMDCHEHGNETQGKEAYIQHLKEWRATIGDLEYEFPYASIGTQFAVLSYTCIEHSLTSSIPASRQTRWVMISFNSEQQITRVLHFEPELIASEMKTFMGINQ